MAVTIIKPDKYTKCICCKSRLCLTEYQFGDDGIKTCITLCCNCVANMYKESVRHEEAKDDKRPEDN